MGSSPFKTFLWMKKSRAASEKTPLSGGNRPTQFGPVSSHSEVRRKPDDAELVPRTGVTGVGEGTLPPHPEKATDADLAIRKDIDLVLDSDSDEDRTSCPAPRRSKRLRAGTGGAASRERRDASRSPIRRERDEAAHRSAAEWSRVVEAKDRELSEQRSRISRLEDRVTQLLKQLEDQGVEAASGRPRRQKEVGRPADPPAFSDAEGFAAFAHKSMNTMERLCEAVFAMSDRLVALEGSRAPAAVRAASPHSGSLMSGDGDPLPRDVPSEGKKRKKRAAQSRPPPKRIGAAEVGENKAGAPVPSTWAQVVNRGGGGRKGETRPLPARVTWPRLPRLPRGAAVSIVAEEGREAEFAGTVVEAMRSVDLEPLGIAALRPKRAASEALIIAIPGPDSQEKADTLAGALGAATLGRGVRVTRPQRWGEVRVRGLTELATPCDGAGRNGCGWGVCGGRCARWGVPAGQRRALRGIRAVPVGGDLQDLKAWRDPARPLRR